MTLKEYLDDNEVTDNFYILMLGKNDSILALEHKKKEDVSEKLMKREFMETNVEENIMEIWVR